MPGHIPDIFLVFKFLTDRLENAAAVGVEVLALPRIAYTTACCYRTSHDQRLNGSSSPMSTATSHLYEKDKNMTPARSKPLI